MKECPKCGSHAVSMNTDSFGNFVGACSDCGFEGLPLPSEDAALEVWEQLPRLYCILHKSQIECRPALCRTCGHNAAERIRRLEAIRAGGLIDENGIRRLHVRTERTGGDTSHPD